MLLTFNIILSGQKTEQPSFFYTRRSRTLKKRPEVTSASPSLVLWGRGRRRKQANGTTIYRICVAVSSAEHLGGGGEGGLRLV